MKLTPPQVAKRYRVNSETVIGWIKSGQLRAIDVSKNPGVGRPRYRIDPTDLIAFENRRLAVSPPKVSRRRRQAGSVIEFF
ncbi:MAG: helix-turn-helix domain-containing protein [Planctomycetota bacterium]|jgi:transposase